MNDFDVLLDYIEERMAEEGGDDDEEEEEDEQELERSYEELWKKLQNWRILLTTWYISTFAMHVFCRASSFECSESESWKIPMNEDQAWSFLTGV